MDETNIDNDLIGCLVKYLIRNKQPSDDGSILVFLPGVPEINDAIETIKRVTQGMSVLLLPLHGGLQPKEQSRVFMRPGNGITKVILSTNVAETSVTIPDCTIVIDTYVFSTCFPLIFKFACIVTNYFLSSLGHEKNSHPMIL